MTVRRAGVAKWAETKALGVEKYAFDPSLRADQVSGLDRLRCVADRKYAAVLFDIYLLAERNEALAEQESRLATASAEKVAQIRVHLRQLAHRALTGELGEEANELARYLVLDAEGHVCEDDKTLAELARALVALGVASSR